jgi:hypothetical protein
MASVTPGFVFSSSTAISATNLNLLGQPSVSIGTNELTLATLPAAASNNLWLARYTTGAGNYQALDAAATGLGYFVGAGGVIAQGTSRTTAVTLNKMCGEITLFSAAGSATPASFTVNNSLVTATDTIILNQKSGTDLYELFITAKGAGTFRITFFTTGGVTVETPVFSYSVIKSIAS